MRLIATQSFPYGGRDLKPGDPFESASDEDARILKGVGKAADAQAEKSAALDTRAMKSEASGDLLNSQPAGKKRGGRYQRSDMRAQD